MKLYKSDFGKIYGIPGDHITSMIEEHGYYEKEMIEIILKNVADKRVAIDVGANIGTHTKAFEKEFERVYSFEPQKSIFEVLEKNSSKYNYNLLIGAVNGYSYVRGNKSNSGAVSMSNSGDMVEMVTLDSFFSELDKLDLLKIDVEGAELLVFYGGRKLIELNRPVIFFENNDYVKFMEKRHYYTRELRSFNIFEFLLADLRYYSIEKLGKNYFATP